MKQETCNYHLCGKKTELFQCRYCEDYFCSEHIRPNEPLTGHYGTRKQKIMEYGLGHPCPECAEQRPKENAIQTERYLAKLDEISGRKSTVSQENQDEVDAPVLTREDYIPLTRGVIKKQRHKKEVQPTDDEGDYEPPRTSTKKSNHKTIFIIIMLALAIFLFYVNSIEQKEQLEQPPKEEASYESSWDSLLTDYGKIQLLKEAGFSENDVQKYYLKNYEQLPNDVLLLLETKLKQEQEADLHYFSDEEKSVTNEIKRFVISIQSKFNEFIEGTGEVTQRIEKKVIETKEELSQEVSVYEKEKSMKAFDYVNQIRKENSVRTISWNDKIYEMALYKAKDMSERYYFDHVDPEGRCVGSYAKEFGLNYPRDTFADNLFSGGSAMEAVDAWMGSRGHRYNLLYSGHNEGALACHWGKCVFIGAGASGWQCATGEEGLAFWNSVGKQSGEK